MSKLYLIRHGLTEWNIKNKFQGATDIPLCAEGIEQAKKLAERMSSYKIDNIYASDLSRAYQTAEYIAQCHNLTVKKIPEIREVNFGEWEGLTIEEISALKEYDFNTWRKSPHNNPFPGEGSFEKVRNRIEKGLNDIINNNDGKDIAIVSHGCSLKIAMISLLKWDLSYYRSFWLGNTALSIIEIREDRNVLNLLNDISHLEIS